MLVRHIFTVVYLLTIVVRNVNNKTPIRSSNAEGKLPFKYLLLMLNIDKRENYHTYCSLSKRNQVRFDRDRTSTLITNPANVCIIPNEVHYESLHKHYVVPFVNENLERSREVSKLTSEKIYCDYTALSGCSNKHEQHS